MKIEIESNQVRIDVKEGDGRQYMLFNYPEYTLEGVTTIFVVGHEDLKGMGLDEEELCTAEQMSVGEYDYLKEGGCKLLRTI